jgi:hypothetical protein
MTTIYPPLISADNSVLIFALADDAKKGSQFCQRVRCFELAALLISTFKCHSVLLVGLRLSFLALFFTLELRQFSVYDGNRRMPVSFNFLVLFLSFLCVFTALHFRS